MINKNFFGPIAHDLFHDMIPTFCIPFLQIFYTEMCLLMFVLNGEFVWGWTIPPKVRPKGLLPS